MSKRTSKWMIVFKGDCELDCVALIIKPIRQIGIYICSKTMKNCPGLGKSGCQAQPVKKNS